MKTNFLALIFLLPSLIWAQQKGVTPINNTIIPNTQSHTQTYAVVVGISDYQSDRIPDLKYAHRDAEAFANWLLSPAGGDVTKENIHLLTNTAATNAGIILSLDWLIEQCKAGDRAFIYFSGHGDVERITKFNNGYLLGYDSPPAVYGAGAFAVNYLKDIIATLSDNGVQVFLISDACRAGKLAGSSFNGTQVTAARLSQQFANEIKILSCQPDEFSLEGGQWGGGRGCFSYHLENALYGFADKNEDAEINLMELGNYLQEKVSSEASPDSQIPLVVGPLRVRIAKVDAAAYAARQDSLKNRNVQFLAIDSKGVEEIIFAETDTSYQNIYNLFLAAIDSSHLMAPEGSSANDYYNALMANADIEMLQGTVKRKFVMALMDEGQQIINKIMETDPAILDNIWADKVEYDHLPSYFQRASEILGKEHYVYNNLKAKELYFRAKTIRSENYPNSTIVWRKEERKRLLEQAFALDSTLVVALFDLADEMPIDKMQVEYLTKTVQIAPNWVLGHYMMGRTFNDRELRWRGKYEKAIVHFKKAMALDSTFLQSYNWISWVYDKKGFPDSALYFKRKYVDKLYEKMQKDSASIKAYELKDLGNALWGLGEYKKAETYLLMSERMSGGKYMPVYANLTVVYCDLLEFEKAVNAHDHLLKSGGSGQKNQPGKIYFNYLYNTEKAIASWVEKGEEGGHAHIEARMAMGDYDKAYQLAKKVTDRNRNTIIHSSWYYYVAESALKMRQKDTAEVYFRKIIETAKVEFNTYNNFYPNYLFVNIAYHRLGQMSSFQSLIVTAKEALPKDPWHNYHLAQIYAMTNQQDLAIQNLYKAVELGWHPNPVQWVHGTLCDHYLNPIRETDAYGVFVKKHFPRFYDIATRVPGR